MRRLILLGVCALTVLGLVLTAGPTFGQSPNGTVTASVTVNVGPCISVSPTSFTYAPAEFSTSQVTRTTLPNGTKPVVTNCSNQTENILARGGQATGTGASWNLVGAVTCTAGSLDEYRHELQQLGSGSYAPLSSTDQTWESGVLAVAGSNTRTVDARLTMPCTGSSGAGQTMQMPILLTAIIP